MHEVISLAQAILYLMLSIWLAIHASVAAHSFGVCTPQFRDITPHTDPNSQQTVQFRNTQPCTNIAGVPKLLVLKIPRTCHFEKPSVLIPLGVFLKSSSPFQGLILLNVHAPYICPPTIWLSHWNFVGNPSSLEADDLLGACCREAMPPKKLWT